MNQFRIPFNVCAQNLRRWATDYKIWSVFIFVLVVNDMIVSGMLDCSKDTGVNCAPWLFPFYNEGIMSKMLFVFPALLMFSDAPFINSNQPYVVSRGKRMPWSIGQVLYIFAASIIYVFVNLLFSIVLLIGHMDMTAEWGKLIIAAAKFTIVPQSVYINIDVVNLYTPLGAMLYSVILNIFACAFVGLLIYVVNIISDKKGYGILAAMGFIILGGYSYIFNEEYRHTEWIGYLSPMSWNTLSALKMNEEMKEPSFAYAICAYITVTMALSVTAILISRKQEINVTQSVL